MSYLYTVKVREKSGLVGYLMDDPDCSFTLDEDQAGKFEPEMVRDLFNGFAAYIDVVVVEVRIVS